MRVTNNMILTNARTNINGTKVGVDKANTQMTTQKKISRPSEDPVTAIRSLRLGTSLSRVDQYYDKNIPDAESWLDVTETALSNMKSIITDYRTLAVNGSTGTNTQDDRNTMLSQLKALQQQLYSEGNADYAGRTVFTGYRTDQTLTFMEDSAETSYTITQSFKAADDLEEYRYYNGNLEVPSNATEIENNPISDIAKTDYNRIRLGYDNLDDIQSIKIGNATFDFGALDKATATDPYKYAEDAGVTVDTLANGNKALSLANNTYLDSNGAAISITVKVFENEDDWSTVNGGKTIGANDVVIIKSTGEAVFGEDINATLRSDKASIDVRYDKTGFKNGELKPEYYYNCTDTSDRLVSSADKWTSYTKFDANGKEVQYDINYTVASNQELTVNLEASDVFNADIYQDIQDMIDAISASVTAHEKLTKIETMIGEEQYQAEATQTKLAEWKEAAQKEADYYDNHVQKLFSSYIGNADNYLGEITLALTDVGCRGDQLTMTKTRMSNQQETLEELKSANDDLDLSDIVLQYTAAYTAYQSSLTAAGKLGQISLLNYI